MKDRPGAHILNASRMSEANNDLDLGLGKVIHIQSILEYPLQLYLRTIQILNGRLHSYIGKHVRHHSLQFMGFSALG